MKRAQRKKRPTVSPVKGVWQRALVILIAGGLTYWNSLSRPFIFDDFGTIVRNPQIRSLWTWDVLSPPANTAVAGRPLVNLSFAINNTLGGLDVHGYHVANITLHLICGLLILGLVRRTLDISGAPASIRHRSVDLALVVALIWTVHPLNSEVVDYLTQRTESMMAVCYLLTLYASVRALGSRRARWYATAIVACLAGMACKETMGTAPLIVVLYDRIFVFDSFRQALQKRWYFYAALAATWLLAAALLISNGQTLSAGFGTAQASPWTYLLNQSIMLTRYLWLAVWPRSLVLYYGWPRAVTLGDVWPYGLFVVMLLIATIVALKRSPRLGFLGAFIFITLAPSSSVVPVATEVGAERRMYLPLVALISLGVVGTALLSDRVSRGERVRSSATPVRSTPLATVFVVLLTSTLAARTMVRNGEYGSALTMARTVLARWPSPNAHYLVGTELGATGQHQEAIAHLREAVAGYPPARFFLGSELLSVGRPDEGIEQLQAFLREEPHLLAARTAHGLLANTLTEQQRFEDAIPHYRAYLEGSPNDGNAWTGLGIALVTTGRTNDSLDAFRRAVQADSTNVRFRLNLARALMDGGDLQAAAELARQAAATNPTDPASHDILGRVLAYEGKLDEAQREFERALEIDPSYTPAVEGLRSLRERGFKKNGPGR